MVHIYDFLIQTNTPMYKGEGATMGGTERQILTVAEQLANKGLNIGIIHSETDGYDRIVNGVKHLNKYRHHYAQSKVRLTCSQLPYMHNIHRDFAMSGSHIPILSPLEINSAEKCYNWMHNWFPASNLIPRIFLSEATKKYQEKKNKNDLVIPYMIPNGLSHEPVNKRDNYVFWMSAMAKGLKEAILTYIALYERGMRRPFYICIPPQRRKRDVEITETLIKDINQHNYPIKFLGELQYNTAMTWLSRAACLFRPSSPQETFGLVYLEANYLGVPVLTNSIDSAKEVIRDKNNMFIEKNTKIEDILEWQNNIEKKVTKVDLKKFGVEPITKKWMSLLE